MPDERPLILLVCTGNLCRSPAAEYLLREHLGGAPYRVQSAGVEAISGKPMDQTMAGLLHRRGIETESFQSTWMTGSTALGADLVLTASVTHRAAVVKMLPPMLSRTLTIKQLARYAPAILQGRFVGEDPHERIRWILDSLPRARSSSPRDEDDSISDPIRKPSRVYEHTFAQIDKAVVKIAPLLTSYPSGIPSGY